MTPRPPPPPGPISGAPPYGGRSNATELRRGAGRADDGPELYRLPPDVHPPPDAIAFDLAGAVTTNSAAFVQVATLTLAASRPGVIREVELAIIGNVIATTDARFQLMVSGSAITGWEDYRLPPMPGSGVAKDVNPTATFIRIPSGARLEIRARSVDGAVYTLWGRVHGWTWGQG